MHVSTMAKFNTLCLAKAVSMCNVLSIYIIMRWFNTLIIASYVNYGIDTIIGWRLTSVLSSSRHHPQDENLPLKDQTLNHHPSAFSYHPTYCHHHFPTACWNKIHVQNHINCYLWHRQQSGAVGACWAHNPEVDGSKPSSAKNLFFFLFFPLPFLFIHFICLFLLRHLPWCYTAGVQVRIHVVRVSTLIWQLCGRAYSSTLNF